MYYIHIFKQELYDACTYTASTLDIYNAMIFKTSFADYALLKLKVIICEKIKKADQRLNLNMYLYI